MPLLLKGYPSSRAGLCYFPSCCVSGATRNACGRLRRAQGCHWSPQWNHTSFETEDAPFLSPGCFNCGIQGSSSCSGTSHLSPTVCLAALPNRSCPSLFLLRVPLRIPIIHDTSTLASHDSTILGHPSLMDCHPCTMLAACHLASSELGGPATHAIACWKCQESFRDFFSQCAHGSPAEQRIRPPGVTPLPHVPTRLSLARMDCHPQVQSSRCATQTRSIRCANQRSSYK
ncbi:hypothetical protein FB45DRAFT_26776 [Roridomyces roridus]|uniref:Uncharacterized protein n=1 Tax=Roridomyces roridus TaxID=1738132 RepID=A0AAD7CJZ8_9AGAR|nr:hypothetical protein FB45DRAFT_26776 [Roridomyces roridus]